MAIFWTKVLYPILLLSLLSRLSSCEMSLQGVSSDLFDLLSYEPDASCELHQPFLCGPEVREQAWSLLQDWHVARKHAFVIVICLVYFTPLKPRRLQILLMWLLLKKKKAAVSILYTVYDYVHVVRIVLGLPVNNCPFVSLLEKLYWWGSG